jgi:RNA polymerase sporulation-specific sigma factor
MTHQTRALSLLLCICLLISFTLCLFSCSGDPTTENRVISVTAEKQKLRVEAALTQGFLEGYTEKKVYLFELPSYLSADTDLSELDPVAEVKPRAKISFTLSVYDGARSRLYSSFLVAAYDAAEDQFIPLTSPMALSNPEAMVISKEDLSVIEGKIGEMLSDLEKDVLIKYMEGKSYQEISCELDRHVKSIDNALQRVKRKLQKYLDAK